MIYFYVPHMSKDAILPYEESLRQAMLEGDVNSLSALFHQDLQYTIPDGTVLDKQADLANYIEGKIRFYDIDILEQTVEETNQGFDVKSIVEIKGFFGQLPMDGHYLFHREWVHNGIGYQIIGGRSTWLNV